MENTELFNKVFKALDNNQELRDNIEKVIEIVSDDMARDTTIYKLMDMENSEIIKYINEPWWNDETIPCSYGTPVAYFIPLHRILIPD